MRRWSGWSAFAAWSLAGTLFVLSVLGAASIGLFILPLALIALFLAVRFCSRWPEALGLLAGAGAVALLVAYRSRDYNPCPDSGIITGNGECGGFSPTPWLVLGVVLLAASLVAYMGAVRWRRQSLSPRDIANPS
jgi:hypothetical protein